MSARCPQCKKVLSWSVKDRLVPKLMDGHCITCPHCDAKLIMDYWSLKQWTYRTLIGISAVALYFILQALNLTIWALIPVLSIYIVSVIYIYFRVRKAIYADSRLNHSQPKQPWDKT